MISARWAGTAAVALVAGGAALWIFPEARTVFPTSIPGTEGNRSAKPAADDHAHRSDRIAKLTDDQIARAKIEVAAATRGVIVDRLAVPGTLVPDADRVAGVAAKVVGTVAELRKRLGDSVARGEVVAVLESREVADAKTDYLAAVVHFDLQKTLFEREQALYEKRVTPEQQFLRSRNAFIEAQLRVNVARQKLAALDLSEAEIAKLSMQQTASLRHKELRAPLDGQVVERRVNLGAPVGREGQESELFVIADLSSLWIELSVPTADIAAIKVDQPVAVAAGPNGARTEARIIFVSPLLHAETRSARAIAAMDNKNMTWRPGAFVTAHITVAEHTVDLRVPRGALQTMAGEQILFVRTAEGFEKRGVVVGRADEAHAEIVSGLDPGEVIAVTNTFVLKAEIGKGEGEHDHAH
jgi:cobalt-zinc-cadmium efflux system membrane fusion protein